MMQNVYLIHIHYQFIGLGMEPFLKMPLVYVKLLLDACSH